MHNIAKRVNAKDGAYLQTLEGHTGDALKIFYSYLDKKFPVLKEFCAKWNLNEAEFIRKVFLTIALHDVGKLTKQFQRNIENDKSSSNYPHPLFALPILDRINFDGSSGASSRDSFLNQYPLETLAILGHHTQLYKGIYSGRIESNREPDYLEYEIPNFVSDFIPAAYKKIRFDKYFVLGDILRRDKKLSNFNSIGIRKYFERIDSLKCKDDNYKCKAVFTYLFSLLQLADDYSSFNFYKFITETHGALQDKNNKVDKVNETLGSILNKPGEYIYSLSISREKLPGILFGENKPYKFQDETEVCGENCFLFAPCGRGKTEASLLWAFNTINNKKRDRIIFALPTQVTCNAMYKKFSRLFGSENVALFHGASDLFMEMEYASENEHNGNSDEDSDEEKRHINEESFKGKTFLKPITVTTIDHLALALIHGFGQADFASGNMQTSAIIFDEVHYYETHTLEVLLFVFQALRKMYIPHLLMTGTAPDFLMDKLQDDYQIVKDLEGLQFKPFSITTKNEDIIVYDAEKVQADSKELEAILNDYRSGKKVFVVLNRVDSAQNFYLGLKEYFKSKGEETKNLILYHSRFISEHRYNKEKEITSIAKKKGPCVIVATQVIEISLDISSDKLYTQVAPPDAIGQRAGRLNRGGKNPDGELIVFNVPRDYALPYEPDTLESTWNTIINYKEVSYADIKKICDTVYKDVELEKDSVFRNVRNAFKENVFFGDKPEQIATKDEEGKGIEIRERRYQTINVIPKEFVKKVKSAESPREMSKSLFKYKCTIPISYYFSDKKKDGNNFYFAEHLGKQFLVCCYDYTDEVGLKVSNSRKERCEDDSFL